ncbi:hypothetical protein LWI28_014068 [Acer negundo]|uniref:J domain-containing protein n=1 Tax=Acer negundo TaxID=4023 RepID=A0AAD5IIA6_ACENE|nr:hypothetical protein LWI28_014068 [Acer negundo]KAK4843975.1 hypothetical protein QYF36_014971 [Acer negundo]
MHSSFSTVIAPVLSIKFKSSSPAPPRVRLHPSLATATITAASSRTQTEERRSTSTFLRPDHLMASCASTNTLYQILGIPVGATGQEIKTAYRRLARTCHPDVATYDCKDRSANEFIKIHAAYCTLSDPDKRVVYDQKLFRRNRPLTSASGFSGYSGRSWETDQCW